MGLLPAATPSGSQDGDHILLVPVFPGPRAVPRTYSSGSVAWKVKSHFLFFPTVKHTKHKIDHNYFEACDLVALSTCMVL